MSTLHREVLTVCLVTTGIPDSDGVPVVTTTTRPWGPCNVQQSGTTEERNGREVVTVGLRASGPLAEWVSAGDIIERPRDGAVYQVDGAPAHYVGGALDHTEVRLVAWSGV